MSMRPLPDLSWSMVSRWLDFFLWLWMRMGILPKNFCNVEKLHQILQYNIIANTFIGLLFYLYLPVFA